MTDTLQRLLHIVSTQLDVKVQQQDINPEVSLLEEGLGLDSIAIVELVSLIEENFSVQFLEEDLRMEPFSSIRTLADYVDELCARERQSA